MTDDIKILEVFQGRKLIFPGPNPKFSLGKNKTISSNFCHSKKQLKLSLHKIKNYGCESDVSVGLVCLENWWRNFNEIPGVFQENREIICFSKGFPGSWKKISKFQEFSRRTGKLSVFPRVFQGPGKKFQNSRSFPGILRVVSTLCEDKNFSKVRNISFIITNFIITIKSTHKIIINLPLS